MQPVWRSSTTSLITPTSDPSAVRIFEPIILLLCTNPVEVLDVVVVWVCACDGAMARPPTAMIAPKRSSFFICCVVTDEVGLLLFSAPGVRFEHRPSCARVAARCRWNSYDPTTAGSQNAVDRIQMLRV